MIAHNTSGLNPSQEEAVQAPDKPLLIVAGAGTGKTRTLTMRILHLLGRKVPSGRICALTFTNKAAREIEERVLHHYQTGVWPGGGEKPFLGTFHSFGARILRKEGRLFGRTPDFVIFDNNDSLQVVKKVMKNLGMAEVKKVRGKERGPGHFLDKISKIKNGMISTDEDETLDRIYIEYEKELEKNNAFDFDDLIEKVVAAFRKHPETLARYHNRYSHFLVDEYQDVNNMQYAMVSLLARPTGNLSVVGDDQQTIYSWRGSNFDIFMNFERDWPGAQVVVLDQNYRSSQNIINAASAVVANNKKQKPKTLWTENALGTKVRMVEAIDDADEAEWIADEIAEKREEFKSTAILYRTNAQSRAIEQALLRRGVLYSVYGGLKFYERKEIRDIVAGLRYALNPKDEISKERLEKNLTKTRFRAFDVALADFFASSAPEKKGDPVELIKLFLRSMDYFAFIDRNLTNGTERYENITALVEFASEFTDLSQMIEEISLLQATDAMQEGKRKKREANKDQGAMFKKNDVQLMTMHLAKGLEFDTVFIIGANEGLLPHARSIESEADLEEERRLMYVGMTRARERLTISFYDIPSRFLSEIPQEFLEYKSLSPDGVDAVALDDEERYITY